MTAPQDDRATRPLAGTVAIITGASRGIGRVTSTVFAAQGARVVCASRSAPALAETVAAIAAAGGEAIAVAADVSRESDVRALVASAVERFGDLNALVNNAGDSGPTAPLQDYSFEDWVATIHSCLTSTYLCSRFAVEPMTRAGGGAIVNIASMAAQRGLAFRAGYCAAKGGQLGLTRGLARELGSRGIRVNAIVPGAVAGDRIDRVIAGQAKALGRSEDDIRRSVLERTPLGTMVTPEDVARLAAFLCSDAARRISGQCIPVTGGEPA